MEDRELWEPENRGNFLRSVIEAFVIIVGGYAVLISLVVLLS